MHSKNVQVYHDHGHSGLEYIPWMVFTNHRLAHLHTWAI